MFIDQYWGEVSAAAQHDAQALVDYLGSKSEEIVAVADIFSDLGLTDLAGNFTGGELDAGPDSGPAHFSYTYNPVLVLAVLLLESKKVGRFNLARVGGKQDRMMRIDADPKTHTQITTALKYFALSPEDHEAAQSYEEPYDVADLSEELRGKLES